MAALKWSSIALTAALLISFVICSAAQPITERDGKPPPVSVDDNMIDSEMVLKNNDHINCNCGAGCGCGGQATGKLYYCRPSNCGGDPACGGGFTMSFDSYVPASANAPAHD